MNGRSETALVTGTLTRSSGPRSGSRSWATSSRLALIASMVICCYLRTLEYRMVGSEVYSGDLLYAPPPLLYLCIGYFLAVVPTIWMPIALRLPSDIALWVIYLVVVIPVMFIPYHVLPSSDASEIVGLSLAIFAAFAMLSLLSVVPRGRIRRWAVPAEPFKLFCVVGTAGVAVLLAVAHGFDFRVGLDEIYTRRFEARTTISDRSTLSYLVSLFQDVLVPLVIVLGLAGRRRVLTIAGLVMVIPAFALTAEKGVIAAPILLLAMAYLLRKRPAQLGILLVMGLSALFVASIVEYRVAGTSNVSAYLTRRVLTVPAQLTAYYWEYYSDPNVSGGHAGLVGSLLGTSESLSPGFRIGTHYFDSPETNSGANLWASGYADAGLLGIAIYTAVAAMIFRFCDGVVRHGNRLAGTLIVLLIGLAFTEGNIRTSLLSAGVFGLLVALFVMPATADERPATGGRAA